MKAQKRSSKQPKPLLPAPTTAELAVIGWWRDNGLEPDDVIRILTQHQASPPTELSPSELAVLAAFRRSDVDADEVIDFLIQAASNSISDVATHAARTGRLD